MNLLVTTYSVITHAVLFDSHLYQCLLSLSTREESSYFFKNQVLVSSRTREDQNPFQKTVQTLRLTWFEFYWTDLWSCGYIKNFPTLLQAGTSSLQANIQLSEKNGPSQASWA